MNEMSTKFQLTADNYYSDEANACKYVERSYGWKCQSC